eukprot:8220596-Alexandrium_andersonii.AAC.1
MLARLRLREEHLLAEAADGAVVLVPVEAPPRRVMVASAHCEAVVGPRAVADGPREQEVVGVHVHAVVLAHFTDE